jgi:hypothetical protein
LWRIWHYHIDLVTTKREGHEGFGSSYISIFFLRALRDLRGELPASLLVGALPRCAFRGEYSSTLNPEEPKVRQQASGLEVSCGAVRHARDHTGSAD